MQVMLEKGMHLCGGGGVWHKSADGRGGAQRLLPRPQQHARHALQRLLQHDVQVWRRVALPQARRVLLHALVNLLQVYMQRALSILSKQWIHELALSAQEISAWRLPIGSQQASCRRCFDSNGPVPQRLLTGWRWVLSAPAGRSRTAPGTAAHAATGRAAAETAGAGSAAVAAGAAAAAAPAEVLAG